MTINVVKLEIAGPTALWTRLDSGSCPRSYPAPTFAAAKGIFEAVRNWQRVVVVRPLRAEICAPVQFHRYTTNYGGPLRKDTQLKKGDSFQLHAEVLVNVVYRLYARVDRIAFGPINAVHAYCEVFNRALDSGRYHHMPFLGWREFVPAYVGPFRDETKVCEAENHVLPTMHWSVFDKLRDGQVNPQVRRNVTITKGGLDYV